jgi:hypothetical protein
LLWMLVWHMLQRRHMQMKMVTIEGMTKCGQVTGGGTHK